MRYAQVDADGLAVVFLHGAPDDWPDLRDAGVLRLAPDGVEAGHRWNGAAWVVPAVAPPPPLSPLEFRRRFTAQERGAITLAASRALEAGNPALQVWLDDLNSATEVHLDHPDLLAGLAALVAAGLVTQSRVDELTA